MSASSEKPFTMGIIGCGNMGIAILSGILSSLNDPQTSSSSNPLPFRIPSRFIATVRSDASQDKVKKAIAPLHSTSPVQFTQNQVEAAANSDIILLATKPYLASSVLCQTGMAAALSNKTLVSILAGVTVAQIRDLVPATNLQIIRAMPNTASLIRESMTVISTSSPPLPAATTDLVTWIFRQIGDVVLLRYALSPRFCAEQSPGED
jgi:pyrroline-5-carboxylate reductase